MSKLKNSSAFFSTLIILFFSITFSIGCSNSKSGGGGVAADATRNSAGLGPAPVSLAPPGSKEFNSADMSACGNYVIIAKTAISTTGSSAITGDIAVSPAAASYITGFSLVADSTNVFSTSPGLVTGKIYAANYAVPTPSNLTSAVGCVETAYTDAASRSLPDFKELAVGNIGGLTLSPGLYNWTNSVNILNDITISGSPTDTWIFQIAGDLNLASGKRITLAGGALAKNIYWQVAGEVILNTTSHFEGIILSKTATTFNAGATMNGRVFAQTAVSLSGTTVTQP